MGLGDNVLAAWKFDGDLTDETTNYDATNNGTATDTTIKILGSASRRYDGSNDNLVLSNSMMDSHAAFSMSIWFYLDDDPSGGGASDRNTLWGMGTQTGTPDDSFLWVENSSGTGNVNKLRLRLATTENANISYGSATITITTWHHVLLIFDGSTCKVYLDGSGTEDISIVSTGTLGTTSASHYFGRRVGESYWDGSIDDCTIWTDAKANTDAATLWNGGAGLAYPFGPSGWTGDIAGVTNPAEVNGIAVANITSIDGVS